jgi:selenocysteine lyase/cysteine desulfurase
MNDQSPHTHDDPLGVRSDFPVVDEAIYLASPFITPSPQTAVLAAQQFAAAKGHLPYYLDDMLAKCDELRGQYAILINAQTAEIGLLYTTSEAENMVVASLNLQPGDNIVINDLHYYASFVIYEQWIKRGIEIRIVPSVAGATPPENFASLIDKKTRLVSVAWISHQNGYRHDLATLAQLAQAQGAYLYADVIQGVGTLPLDIQAAGLDFCSAGSYKWLLGGFGVALFYVREALLPMIEPHGYGLFHVVEKSGPLTHRIFEDGRKFMYATPSFGAVYQLSAGLDYLLKIGVTHIAAHVLPLAHYLHDSLAAMGYEVVTPPDNNSAVVAFKHGRDAVELKRRLADAHIHVTFRESDSQIRAGVALFNNRAEVDHFLAVLAG